MSTLTEQIQWYAESMHNYAAEFRLHIANGECFMTWRKLRRRDAEDRHYFNSANCNWVGEDHELFDHPKCWDAMVEHAVKCLKATGLDIGACDVRVQSNRNDDPKFIVCEINSAPALGEAGNESYYNEIVKLVEKKSKDNE